MNIFEMISNLTNQQLIMYSLIICGSLAVIISFIIVLAMKRKERKMTKSYKVEQNGTKKDTSKEEKKNKIKETKRAKNIDSVTALIPILHVDEQYDAFILTDNRYMDLIQIVCKDLNAASYDEIDNDNIQFDRLFKTYSDDLKLISMNFPTDTQTQQIYLQRRIDHTVNEIYKEQLERKMAELELIHEQRTDREYYLMFFSTGKDNYEDNLNHILKSLSRGSQPLARRIPLEKKKQLLYKMMNKSSSIS